MRTLPRPRRTLAALFACAFALLAAPAAEAAIPDVFGGAVDCETEDDGVRFCGGTGTVVNTFDGVPIDVNVALPPEPETGPDGDFPAIGTFHGWGGSEMGLGSMRRFAERGYAVFSMSDRGFGESCGGLSQRRLTLDCIGKGHVRLMDTRYEVRDAQEFFGRLNDEGVIDGQRIGSHGGSYGGGMSMALGALRNRKMLPDGSLVPWTSPDGDPMEIAAATPGIPWTDLAYALVPNGRTLDYVADAPYTGPDGDAPTGVLKQSFVAGLFATGAAVASYALPATDPDADLITWYGLLNAGEPYDALPLADDITDEVTTHHSSYYIDDSVEPAPMLISNGWTDDLFPADEAIRFYNRTRAEHPGADINLMFLDYGHMRGQNKGADTALLRAREDAWFDHYLQGEGSKPADGVTTLTQSCPSSAPSGGPFEADEWAEIAPGEVRLTAAAQKIIAPVVATDVQVSRAFDPVAGGGACATAPGDDQLGAASYRLDPAPAGGYTLMGSPTVIADIASPGPHSQLAARLLDVAPNGQETLVARGLYRPDSGLNPTRQVFQLHPNGWRFEQGHVAKLELLPSDVPYGRITNGQAPVLVSNLDFRIPVLEQPGTGPVAAPEPKFVPDGYELAPGYVDVDSDGDTVLDEDDDCPADPGPPASNGCPLPDADQDGVPDAEDECDDEPGPASNDGCPVVGDDDADDDGVKDVDDACPSVPGPAENAGCPLPEDDDADDDGVPDEDDACPGDSGAIENQGCPEDGGGDCEQAIEGTRGDDRLKGTPASERMRGRAGDDRLKGAGGDDCLHGGGGDDVLKGGRADDTIKPGPGEDVIRCGPGDDTVFTKGNDRIRGDCEEVSRR
jgi:predicted acyl esterase